MDLDLDMFGTSVQEAVLATIRMNKPMFVYLSKGDDDYPSVEFVTRHLLGDGEIHQQVGRILRAKFVLLKLVDGTVEFGYFKQIFPSVVMPSFYVVRQGQLLGVISGDDSTELLAALVEKTGGVEEEAGQEPAITDEQQQQQHQQYQQYQQQQPSVTEQPAHTEQSAAQPAPNVDSEPVNHVPSHDQSVREHTRAVARERKIQADERKRLRDLLRADARERESRKREEERNQKNEERTVNTVHASSSQCVLSIKLFDGSSLRQEFKPTQTLNDVRHWLDTETAEPIISEPSMASFASAYPQPTHYVFHHPTIPRTTFTDEQEFTLLQELGLCPRSALILKPIYDDKYSKSYPDGKVSSGGLLKSMGSTLGRTVNALYSFFDYGVEDYRNDSHEDHEDSVHDSVQEEFNPVLSGIDRSTPGIERNRSSPMMERNRSTASIPDCETPNYSRLSTPKPNARMQSMSRIQTIHDDDPKKDTESYNGNTVNLRKGDDDP